MDKTPGNGVPKARFTSGKNFVLVRADILGKNLVEFTGHALRRMESRAVTQDDVLRVIRNPQEINLPADAGKTRVRGRIDLRTTIDVVYEIKADRIGIISAWATKRGLVRIGRGSR